MRELDFRLHNILIYEIGEGKGGKCLEKENVFFLEKKEKGDGKGGKYDREGEYFNDGRVDRRKEDTSKVL